MTTTVQQHSLGMISTQEQEYLRCYASREYSGKGEIVDLGCWLGSSTIELAKGLQLNPNASSVLKIHAYDLFIWESWMDSLTCVVGTSLEGKFKPGDSFLQECVERIQPWQEQIKLYPGDLNQLGWQGGAIEFLFVDAMKSWELANTIVHDFFPALMPGRSVVVQQDFCHHHTYWIHLIMYRLRDYFEPIYDVPYSASLVYKYIKPIPAGLLEASYTLESFSEEEINAAFNYSSQLVSADKKFIVLSGKVLAFSELGAANHRGQVYAAINDIYQIYGEIAGLKLQLEQAEAKLKTLESPQPILITSTPKELQDGKAKLQQQLKNVRRRAQTLESELQGAKQRIQAMESSKFWKLRAQWFNLKKTLGLPTDD